MRARAGASKGGTEFARVQAAAKFLLKKTKLRPRVGVVLGSGLGGFADELKDATKIPYQKIPGFARSTVIGHAGRLVIGTTAGTPVAAMQGRIHVYEGYPIRDVVFPIRVLWAMGVRAVVLTNAAGGINREYKQGALVLIRDHINLQGQNPLIGANEERFGVRFPDMTEAYSQKLRDLARDEARKLDIDLRDGVYAALAGPSYETPAEIRFLRTIGADLVGMSTVSEVIAARHLGMSVLGISCVTNAAAGVLDKPLDHAEVMATTERVKEDFVALIRGVLPRIAGGTEAETPRHGRLTGQ
jgi:purine-nucleoside phosphorylase